jgi:hypothetical protein
LRKLLFSFRNLAGELNGNFIEEINKISSIIPVQKEKIIELENQCVSLEKQMSMQKEVVQEELSSACKMLLSANNLILLQKKTIESLASNISELQLEKKSIQNNGKNFNNEVVKKVVTPKKIEEKKEISRLSKLRFSMKMIMRRVRKRMEMIEM